jgi:hypothetical protein
MSGARPFRRELGSSSAVPVFSKALVEQMAKGTRKSKGSKKAKGTRKGKRALTPWNKLVMKVYHEMKAKDKNTKFSAALKAAAKRKSEM